VVLALSPDFAKNIVGIASAYMVTCLMSDRKVTVRAIASMISSYW